MQLLSPLPERDRHNRATRSDPSDLPDFDRFLSRDEVLKITSLSCTTIQRAINAGTFPPPIPLSHNRVGWLASEIAAWQRTRIAARDREHPAA